MRESYISVAPDFWIRVFLSTRESAFKQEWKGTKDFLSCVDSSGL